MSHLSEDVVFNVTKNISWAKLPSSVKQSLGNSPSLYDKAVAEICIRNQLRWRTSIVRYIKQDERKYYENLLAYSREHLMLYPYHLQDMMVQGLRVTAFSYYTSMVGDIMMKEHSYDSLPNFTAADCLRLLGIGRNQYIDLMNQFRSKKFFRRRGVKELLPTQPVAHSTHMQPWWIVHVGYVTEDDIKSCSTEEHQTVDRIIDSGTLHAGAISKDLLLSLYTKGLVYLNVPIGDRDLIVVPTLQGFVMNRVQGDYFETLLYKVFVSLDEHTDMLELSSVLQIDLQQVKNAVSVFIRLGFAHKKTVGTSHLALHPSWSTPHPSPLSSPFPHLSQGTSPLTLKDTPSGSVLEDSNEFLSTRAFQKRIGFLFDSSLTAFLMMGNLSPGLKNHAVTMFEVGKLTDESMDNFLLELDKVGAQAEGEAQRYFVHAICLRRTIAFLRHNASLLRGEGGRGSGLDLLRCESMASLDQPTLARVLQKNYIALVSMAPLSQEVESIGTSLPPHIGPPVAEMNSIWFKLWLYQKLCSGPPSLLLTKGSRLRKLPAFLKGYSRVLVTMWGHDPTLVSLSSLLLTLNDALTHSAVLVQGHGWRGGEGEVRHLPLPFDPSPAKGGEGELLAGHPCVQVLGELLDLRHTCGFLSFLKTGAPHTPHHSTNSTRVGGRKEGGGEEISDFLKDLQELGIGEGRSAADPKPRPSKPVELCPPAEKLWRQWVPMEMWFGIPLFDEDANRRVCDKVLQYNLLSEESMQKLLLANRLLTLDLFTFISQHQDVPYFPSAARDSIEPGTSALAVPMPTRNLYFLDRRLQDFTGR